jgi:hypothetical protein
MTFISHSHLGIDLGKANLHVSYPVPDKKPERWPVVVIDYKDPNWLEQLLALIAPNAVIVCEPTGFHLMSPVAQAVRLWTSATLYLIQHAETGKVRDLYVSATKTDRMDSRALAFAATEITRGVIRNIRPFDQDAERGAQTLRLYLNAHQRLTKINTRYLNQLDALAFSLWPLLSQKKSTWLNAVALGAIDCLQIKHLADNPPPGTSGNIMRFISQLAEQLPALEGDPATIAAIYDLSRQLRALEPQEAHNLGVIHDLIRQPPFLEVTTAWLTVPSAGLTDLAALHVVMRGQPHFFTADQFRAVCGCSPKHRSSGHRSTSRDDQAYYRPAKAALHLWTMRLLKHGQNPISDYYKKCGSPHPFAAARGKLARILHAIAINRQPCRW